jgi:hypothetical protein
MEGIQNLHGGLGEDDIVLSKRGTMDYSRRDIGFLFSLGDDK